MPVPVSSGTIPDVTRTPNQNQPEPKPETLVPLPDAAPLLGLHYDTARKRLQAGTLRGEKHGGRWLVWVPVEGSAERKSETFSDFIPDVIPDDPESNPDAKPEDSGPIPDQTGTESEQGFRTDSVRNPDALLVQLREEIAFLRQQVERQNHLIAGLIQRVPELPTGDAAVAARDPQHETRPVEPAGDALVPWWKFWERWG
ncbi:MAG: hypothetical protein M3R02_24225 [Chloroflexota bacterium]|nr:hypothetical protein [Chloroflexota bacterium]